MECKCKKVLVITGGSSGIGLATAKTFARNGYAVYDLSRSGCDYRGVTHVFCDVTDENLVQNAVSKVIEREGKIDLLINNAGYGISGPIEFTSVQDAKQQFDVNFFGALNVVKAVIPHMRERKSGRIIFTSSVAAVFAIPFQSFYSACKSAINSLTLALSNELKPFNISVCALMPGDVRTEFTANRQKDENGSGVYSRLSKSVSAMEKDEQNGMTAAYVAKKFYKIACKKRVKPLYVAGKKYALFVFLSKILPTRFFNYVVGKLY